MQIIFQFAFHSTELETVSAHYLEATGKKNLSSFTRKLCDGVREHLPELDGWIEQFARGWKINRISKIALAILRISIYEIKFCEDIPQSVSINEAVELAKEYASAEEAAFINGILASVVKEEAAAQS